MNEIALCRESPYNLIDLLGPFYVILQTKNFPKVEILSNSSTGKTVRKITKILQSIGF